MRCPYCKEKVRRNSIKCKHCGSNLEEVQLKNKQKKKKSCLGVIVVFVFVIIIALISNTIKNYQISKDPVKATVDAINRATEQALPTETLEPTETTEPTLTPTKDIESSVKVIMNSVEITEEEAAIAFMEIQKVGLDVVISMELITESDQMKFYQANVGYTKPATISFVNSELFGITMGDNLVLYDADAGGAIDNVENYKLTDEQKSQYIAFAEMTVKKALKAPSTAKFPGWLNWSDWEVWRNKDAVWLKSWVDAQNSFGAMIRSNFVMQFDYETTELIYFELDGQVLYGSIRE